MAEAETAVVCDARLGGHAVTLIGIESRPLPRYGRTPADGPTQWSAGTLFPLSSKKVARAINAASGCRPVVMLANLSGFDGSPESLRRLQLEYGAEIGRAIVNFDGPFVLCVVSRYHGGAFVVFSATLNDDMEVLAVEGSFASVIGGAPAAAVVFTRDVDERTRDDPRVRGAEAALAAATGDEAALRRAELRRAARGRAHREARRGGRRVRRHPQRGAGPRRRVGAPHHRRRRSAPGADRRRRARTRARRAGAGDRHVVAGRLGRLAGVLRRTGRSRRVGGAAPPPPPANAPADYQLGGDYEPPAGVAVVTRDWFAGAPLGGGYSICYVNAFQTQPDEADVDRPDETSNWPSGSVLRRLGEDPNWPGEYLVDIGTPAGRAAAAEHVATDDRDVRTQGLRRRRVRQPRLVDALRRHRSRARCRSTRPTPLPTPPASRPSPTRLGLAVGQKNTPQLDASTSLDVIGFDFAVVEECGRYDECDAYAHVFGDRMIVVEYTDEGFAAACEAVGTSVSVVLRDVDLATPDATGYRYEQC